jgi:hypothetical protein
MWKNILKAHPAGQGYENIDGKELTYENLDIDIELKEVSGSFRRKTSLYGGDRVSDTYMPMSGYSEYGEYQYAFMPKLSGSMELYDGDTLVRKFKAEEIEVSFAGGEFKNIQTFPVPISFEVDIDFDEVPYLSITMKVA